MKDEFKGIKVGDKVAVQDKSLTRNYAVIARSYRPLLVTRVTATQFTTEDGRRWTRSWGDLFGTGGYNSYSAPRVEVWSADHDLANAEYEAAVRRKKMQERVHRAVFSDNLPIDVLTKLYEVVSEFQDRAPATPAPVEATA